MNYKDQEVLNNFLPPELISKINIISIQTDKTAAEIVTAGLSMGLEVLEDITTRQYAYIKIDDNGQAYDLTGDPVRM